jgi:hypothetical protein
LLARKYSVISNQIGWSNSNTPDPYSAGSWFESCLVHQLFWLKFFFVVLLSSSSKFKNIILFRPLPYKSCLGHFLTNHF